MSRLACEFALFWVPVL